MEMAKKQQFDYEKINTYKSSHLIKRFAPYFIKYKSILIMDLICALLTTVCELAFPMIVRFLTSMGLNNPESFTVKVILETGLVYLALRVMDAAAYYYMAYYGHVMGAKIETDMRRDLFNHIQTLSFSYFDNMKIGQLMGRITSDLFDIAEFAHHCPEEYFIAAVKITGSFIICANMNISLTLIIFLIVPIMLVCSLSFRKKMRVTSKLSRDQIGELNSQAEDSMLGVRVVKSFGNEDVEIAKFEAGNSLFLRYKKFTYKYFAGFQTTTRIFDGIMYLAAVVAGSLFIVAGEIGAAELIAYLLYVSTLLTSIRRIVEFNEQFQKGITGVERFLEIMDVDPEIKNEPGALPMNDVKGEVELRDVSFRYDTKYSDPRGASGASDTSGASGLSDASGASDTSDLSGASDISGASGLSDASGACGANAGKSVHSSIESGVFYSDDGSGACALRPVLSHISFSVSPGENIAIVGPSGAGKTTLCGLIPRFYDVTEGAILIDGRDIRQITLESLRHNIGVVQQDVYIFSGTIAENIEYGRPGAGLEDIMEAAKKTGIHDFIMSLPEGYNTYAGERGVKLSGGQKQRISIARVFLKNPPILILDEATSSLDNESEKLVQQSLEKLTEGRTTFTIAHRLTTVRNAERIMVLTTDGIVEQGSHQQLMDLGGIYYGLNQMYEV